MLVARGLSLAGSPRRIGLEAKHLSFYVTDGKKSFKALIFDTPELIRLIEKNPPKFDLAFTPKINIWNNKTDVELYVKDVKIL